MLHEGDTATLAGLLADAYERFDKQGAPLQVVYIASRRCIGVRNERDNIDLTHLRRMIYQKSESESFPLSIVQIVGDSGTEFDNASFLSAQEALARQLENNLLIEYGFTAVKLDANWLVQDYISSRPEAATRTIANIVGRSVEALRSADWEGSELVEIFVMLYNNDGTPTEFGEDTWLSDGIMSSEVGDKMLCFEGGPQAFHQCVNALIQGLEVMVMADLRPVHRSKRFSAARLLLLLKAGGESTELEQLLNDFFHTYPPTKQEQLVAVREDLNRLKQCAYDVSNLISKM